MAKKLNLEFARHVGPILRKARVDQGKTLDVVEDCTGIAKGYLSRVERGHHAISMEKLSVLADFYGFPLSHFIPRNRSKLKQDTHAAVDLNEILFSNERLVFDGETIELTMDTIEKLETAIRMGIAWVQKTQGKDGEKKH